MSTLTHREVSRGVTPAPIYLIQTISIINNNNNNNSTIIITVTVTGNQLLKTLHLPRHVVSLLTPPPFLEVEIRWK
jgi:hypothetical protein